MCNNGKEVIKRNKRCEMNPVPEIAYLSMSLEFE